MTCSSRAPEDQHDFALVVRWPQAFDVILTANLYGDFLSDLTAELVGGLGVGGALNAGHDICAAQAAHGSAPDTIGQNVANPTAMILSVGMLLDWLGARHERADLKDAARRLEAALDQLPAEAAGRTRDLGGALATDAFADALAERIAAARPARPAGFGADGKTMAPWYLTFWSSGASSGPRLPCDRPVRRRARHRSRAERPRG